MYTRKPKDMTKFLVGINAAQALHTWQYADKTRLAQMGSSASLTIAQRKKRDANRKTVGEYRISKVATVANTMRRDVAEFTKGERAKLNTRVERNNSASKLPVPPAPPSKERPRSDASLYRRPIL